MSSKTTATPENALSKAEIDERLAACTLARLASYREDGMIHITPIWFDWTGEVFRLTLGAGRIHLKNLARDGRVSILCVIDRDPRVDEGAQGLAAGAWAIMCRGNATLSQDDALIREVTHAVISRAAYPRLEALAACQGAGAGGCGQVRRAGDGRRPHHRHHHAPGLAHLGLRELRRGRHPGLRSRRSSPHCDPPAPRPAAPADKADD